MLFYCLLFPLNISWIPAFLRMLMLTVQLQPKHIARAKRGYHDSAVCCNRLLDIDRTLLGELEIGATAADAGPSHQRSKMPHSESAHSAST